MKVIQEGAFSTAGRDALLAKLQKAAAERGCDALVDVEAIVEHWETEREGRLFEASRTDRTSLDGYRGRCVVFP
jgi:hypothetical protein